MSAADLNAYRLISPELSHLRDQHAADVERLRRRIDELSTLPAAVRTLRDELAELARRLTNVEHAGEGLTRRLDYLTEAEPAPAVDRNGILCRDLVTVDADDLRWVLRALRQSPFHAGEGVLHAGERVRRLTEAVER